MTKHPSATPFALGCVAVRADGCCTALTVDIAAGEITRASIEDATATLYGWTAPGGRVIGLWTVEAGSVPEFLEAALALFFQRKVDARKAEEALRQLIFKH